MALRFLPWTTGWVVWEEMMISVERKSYLWCQVAMTSEPSWVWSSGERFGLERKM